MPCSPGSYPLIGGVSHEANRDCYTVCTVRRVSASAGTLACNPARERRVRSEIEGVGARLGRSNSEAHEADIRRVASVRHLPGSRCGGVHIVLGLRHHRHALRRDPKPVEDGAPESQGLSKRSMRSSQKAAWTQQDSFFRKSFSNRLSVVPARQHLSHTFIRSACRGIQKGRRTREKHSSDH